VENHVDNVCYCPYSSSSCSSTVNHMKKYTYWLIWGLLVVPQLFAHSTTPTIIGGDKAAFKAYYKGVLLYNDGHFKRAVQQFEKAYQIIPDNYSFTLSLAVSLSRVDRATEGLNLLKKASTSLSSHDPNLAQKKAYRYFFEGMIQSYGGWYGDAVGPLKECIKRQEAIGDPKLLALFNNALGYATVLNQGLGDHGSDTLGLHYHVHQRDLIKALKYFDLALKYDPVNKAALHNYYLIRNALGLEGMEAYQEATDSLPTLIDTPLPGNTKRALQFTSYDELAFLLDISGSMVMETVACMGSTRFDVMKETALFVLDSLPATTQIGLGTIDGDCGTKPAAWDEVGALSHYDMRYRLRFLAPNGTTPLLERLQASADLFHSENGKRKAIFLISDGANVCRIPGADICGWSKELARRNITINILTFLDASYDNTNAFAEYGCLAENTGGQILYLDNYRCSYEYFGTSLAESCLPKIPQLRKVQCWGPAVKGLWAIEVN
jgi:tetratricopeptide (TPR) repeat protein